MVLKTFLISRLMFMPRILDMDEQSEVSRDVSTPTSDWSWKVMSCLSRFSKSLVLSRNTKRWFKNPKVIPLMLAVTLKATERPRSHRMQPRKSSWFPF